MAADSGTGAAGARCSGRCRPAVPRLCMAILSGRCRAGSRPPTASATAQPVTLPGPCQAVSAHLGGPRFFMPDLRLQGTDRIPGNRRSLRGGTSTDGTRRALLHNTAHRRSSGRSPHRRLCCPPGSTGTTAASDAHPASGPLPGITGYRTPGSGDMIRRSPGRGGPPQFPPPPSIRSAPHTPGSPSRLRSRLCTASMAFAPISRGSALPCPEGG